jgi:hypothetical protein
MAWLTPINNNDDETHISPPSPQQSCTSITLKNIILWLMEGNLGPPRNVTVYTHYHQAKWLRRENGPTYIIPQSPPFQMTSASTTKMEATCSSERMEKRHLSTITRKQVNRILKLPLRKLRLQSWGSHKIKCQNELTWWTNRNTCVILITDGQTDICTLLNKGMYCNKGKYIPHI